MDPVYYDIDDDGWYFYDETWQDRFGPYNTEEAARRDLAHYVLWLNWGVESSGNDLCFIPIVPR